jgi:alanyl-tRNA synthetase
VVALSRDLVARGLSARKLIAGLAEKLGGGGGGRDDLAQAGGSNAGALAEALERFVEDARAALAR